MPSIYAQRFPIVGALGGHLYLAILDDSDNLLYEIHGLATDSSTFNINATGSESDLIWGYVMQHAPSTAPYLYSSGHDKVLLATVTNGEVTTVLNELSAAIQYINHQPFHYVLLPDEDDDSTIYYNSNSVFDLLLRVTQTALSGGIASGDITAARELGGSNPGVDADILHGGTWAVNTADASHLGYKLAGDANVNVVVGGDGKDILIGNNGNDVLVGNGGDDLVYGGAEVQTDTANTTDGVDVYFARSILPDGTIPSGTVVIQEVSANHKTVTIGSETDQLYSIEYVFANRSDIPNNLNLELRTQGIEIEDVIPTFKEQLNDQYKDLNSGLDWLDTAVAVGESVYGNFMSFTATSFADSFILSQVIGRAFDGVGGHDNVSYKGVTDFAHGGGYSFGYNAGTLDVIRANATGATDTLTSIMRIETTTQQDYIGLSDLSNTTSTDRLVLVGSAPLTSPDIVSVAMAGGHGGYFEFDTSSGKQAGAVFEFDYTVNAYEMFVSLGTSSREDGIYNDLAVHGLEAGDAVNVAWNQSHVWSGYGMTGVNIGGFAFDTLQLVDYLGDFASNDGTNNSAPEALRGEWRVSYLSEAMNFWFINLGNAYYHVNEGDGTTVIDDANGVTDSLKLGVNVSASSVGYTKTGTDLTIAYGTSGDSVVVQDFFNAATTSHRIEKVQFANGTVHGLPFILEQVFTQNGTASADVLTGVDYVFDPKDYLYGLGGNDTLDGGAGADKMVGGLGDDSYIVDNTGDTITENASEGTDAVSSSVSYTLSANIENLTLTGSGNLNGTGNSEANVITGNSGNNTLDGGAGADTLIGGTGNDTYIVDNTGDVLVENTGEGIDTVSSSASYTLSGNIENLVLTGTANTNATGNGASNTLTGNSGNNTLDGGTGADVMNGGDGNDTYIVDNAGDVISDSAGTDTVYASVSYTLGAGIENFVLTGSGNINGTGGSDSVTITGNSGNNVLTGGAGNQTLDGGVGADTMIGGNGDDLYIADNASDIVSESSGQGTDTVQSSVSYTLATNVEHLVLTGSSNLDGTGNSSVNVLTGNSGNNTLNGSTGADTLIGGAGDDIYVVDDGGDTVSENSAEGSDLVQSSVTYTLAANIERLTLTASALNATGNSGVNTLTGNSGINTLDGGAGADTLLGGLGNDTYVVDDAGDVVSENASEGTDTVSSSVSYSLTANVENLSLTGTSDLTGTGNGSANTLTGNSGSNTLDGGAGADALLGGLGDDVYLVDNGSDTITESASAGTDTVQSSVSYTLSSNVENLTLTGSSDISGTGNTGTNTLIGNSGNNALIGGQGADVLIGGIGDDVYVVDSASDTVTENASEGTDLVQSSINFSIASFANVENLILTGTATSATGNNGSNILIGNSSVNVLTGNDGNDTLDGAAGADTLDGGAGDDKYIVDNVSDFILNANETGGTDTVESNVTFSLSALSNIENLTLTGSTAVTATGSSGNNILSGELNSAVNSLVGGAGDDSYYIGTGDVVVEAASAGTDTVYSSLSTYTLTTNAENLVLTGTGNINGTGNGVANTLTGNSGNNILSGGTGADTLIGGAGDDTYLVDNTGDVVSEDSAEGTDTVSSAVTFSLAGFAHVENLTLTGTTVNGTGNALDNTVTGSSSVNILTGAGGNDYLDGAAGADTMIGGTGDDTFVVSVATDVLSENASEGTDLVISVVTHTLAANFENLTLTAATAINGTGNSDVNTLTGGTGANSLNGMAGADTMVGGAGNDIYFVDDAGDVVIELSAEGTDSVQSSIDYTLTGNVENLTLTGASNLNATGNSAVNTLTGNTGNNTLDGGAGADAMVGGIGNDTYLVDDAGDTVTEAASAGTDLVLSSASFTLGTNLENLTLTGSGDINGTGNTVVNTLTGNSGNNTLTGGTGADTLIGGAGDDTYFVDNAADVVSENASEGTDTVSSTVTFSLASLSNIEHLTLTGTTVINATGNGLDNILTGNAVKNILSGGGGNDTIIAGGGADTMLGGTGDDLYIVSVTTSVISESASEGTDSVQSSVTYTLSAEVENLTLTAATAINGTGNGSANILIGGTGNNALSGGAGNDTLDGGTGLDTLTGGADADIFVLGNVSNIDVVTDFSTAQGDALDIRDLLSGYNPGSHTITDWVRITDVSANSKVEIDRDGTGGTYGWVQIATLNGVTGLTDEAALVANGNLLAA